MSNWPYTDISLAQMIDVIKKWDYRYCWCKIDVELLNKDWVPRNETVKWVIVYVNRRATVHTYNAFWKGNGWERNGDNAALMNEYIIKNWINWWSLSVYSCGKSICGLKDLTQSFYIDTIYKSNTEIYGRVTAFFNPNLE